MPKIVCYKFNGITKHYFGQDFLKGTATDLLTIETEQNFKCNKQMVFTGERNFYQNANKTCHICKKNISIK